MSSTSGWDATLADLAARRRAARAMGGEERLARHRAAGRLDARARLAALLDPGTFREIGTLAGDVPADAFVAGTGLIRGRPVAAGAEDFTTVAGTIGGPANAKRHRLAELALAERMPLVMLLEGAGFRPGGTHARAPVDLLAQARCSGLVPIVAGVFGASAGHGALVAPMADFCVMTAGASIFTAGPPVVAEATGEVVDKLDLGGPAVAARSGLVHNVAGDDLAALAEIRDYLAYFPQSAWSYPPPGSPSPPREVPELLGIVPRDNRQVYDMGDVLGAVLDDGYFEVQAGYGPAIICGLARLGGHPVAVVANQPKVLAGAIDSTAANKATHFVAVADSFHLPLVFVADNPGMLPGTRSERAGVLRAGARMFAAQTTAQTIKLHVTLRKAYGFGSMVMGMMAFEGQSATLAWPGATLGAMSAEASSRASKAAAEQADALRRAELDASYSSAARLGFDELIDPRETRNRLLDALAVALGRRQEPAGPVLRAGIPP